MPARQEFRQQDVRRADMTATLTVALGDLAQGWLALGSDDDAAGLRADEARAVLAVIRRSNRAHPLDEALARAAGSLAARVPGVAAGGTPAAAWISPIDVLHSDRADRIAFTLALAAVTEAGHRLPRLPRPVPQLLQDAEAALGTALLAGDRELTARLLTIWPLLGAPWTAPARCALDELLTPPTLGEPSAPDLATVTALALLLALTLEHGRVPLPWAPTDTDVQVARSLGALDPVRDAALVVSAALSEAALAEDRARLRAILALAVASGVSADAAVAATLEMLCGLGAFTAIAG